MGIMDFTPVNTPAPTVSERVRANRPFAGFGAPERPKAKLWLNIGYEQNGRFVNLPVGTPVDTMEATEAKGQNADWVKFQTARNKLLQALQALGDTLEPGAEIEVPNLIIKLRRTNENMVIAEDENEYAVDLLGLLSGRVPAMAAE